MYDNKPIECPYDVDLPYPSIRVDSPNLTYGCEMLSNIGDVVSEMSDVSRYFYISVVANECYSSIAACFHHISIVEMHHLDIFSKLALLLGEDPRLWCGKTRKRYWSPSYLNYPKDIRGLIAESIKAEEAAISKYSKQASIIRDMNIVAILQRIILDEERHLQIFRDMYHQI